MALLETLTDQFPGSTLDTTTNWSNDSPSFVSVSNGNLNLSVTGASGTLAQISTKATYTLTASAVYAKITPAPGNIQTIMTVVAAAQGYVKLFYDGSTGNMRVITATATGTTTSSTIEAYNANNWVYWRIRFDASNNAFVDRSADGSSWNQVFSAGTLGFTVGYVYLQTQSTAAVNGTSYVDSVNLVGTAPPFAISTLIDDFLGTTLEPTRYITFTSSGTIAVSGGLLRLNTTSASAFAIAQVLAAPVYNILGDAVYAKINPAITAGTQFYLQVNNTNNGFVYLYYDGTTGALGINAYNNANAMVMSNTNFATYNATTWAYWRIRFDASANAFIDRSADGNTWTQALAVGAMGFGATVKTSVQSKNNNSAVNATATVDSFNIPGLLPIANLTDQFTGTTLDTTKWTPTTSSGSVAVSGGFAQLSTTTGSASAFATIFSGNAIGTGSSVYARIIPSTAPNARTVMQLNNTSGTGGYILLSCDRANSLMQIVVVNGSGTTTVNNTVAYDPSSWAYWRIRIDNQFTGFIDRSSDGSTWTQAYATGNVGFGAMVNIAFQQTTNGTAVAATGLIDSVNVIGTASVIVSAVGATTGTSAVTGTARRTRTLATATTGTSTVAGTLVRARTIALSAASTGTSAVTGFATRRRAVTGSTTGTSSVAGLSTASRRLTGATAGTSAATATLTRLSAGFNGASTGTSSATATMIRSRLVTAATTGTSTFTGNSTRTKFLTGSSTGSSSATATPVRIRVTLLSGATVGTSQVTASLFRYGAGFAGLVMGTSTASATMTRRRLVAAAVTGTSSLTGLGTRARAAASTVAGTSAMTATATKEHADVVSGASTGTSATTGTPTRRRTVATASQGLATVTGTLRRDRTVSLAAASTGTSTVAGTGRRVRSIAADAAGTSQATATLSVIHYVNLSGNTACSSTLTGAVSRTVRAAGSATGTSTASAILTRDRQLRAASTGTSYALAWPMGNKRDLDFDGTLTGTSTVTATATRSKAASSTVVGRSAFSGDFARVVPLAVRNGGLGSSKTRAYVSRTRRANASATGTSALVGTITKVHRVYLSGTAAGTSTVTGSATRRRTEAGRIAGTSSAAGAVRNARLLAGASTGVTTLVAKPTRRRTETAATVGLGQLAGAPTKTRGASLRATTAGTSAVTGSVTRTRTVRVTVSGTGSVVGAISARKTLAGTSAGTSTSAGRPIRARSANAGLATGTGSASASIRTARSYRGSTAGTSAVTGAHTRSRTATAASTGTSRVRAAPRITGAVVRPGSTVIARPN